MSAASLTQIRRILQKCQFNPKEAGIMKVITETGNLDYFLLRAVEAIQLTRTTRATNNEQLIQSVRHAIQLLTLALVEAGDGQTKTKD